MSHALLILSTSRVVGFVSRDSGGTRELVTRPFNEPALEYVNNGYAEVIGHSATQNALSMSRT